MKYGTSTFLPYNSQKTHLVVVICHAGSERWKIRKREEFQGILENSNSWNNWNFNCRIEKFDSIPVTQRISSWDSFACRSVYSFPISIIREPLFLLDFGSSTQSIRVLECYDHIFAIIPRYRAVFVIKENESGDKFSKSTWSKFNWSRENSIR